VKKHRTWMLALVSLSLAVLACGFPLPLVQDALDQWAGPACGADEPAKSCAARQDAYLTLATTGTVSVTDVEMYLYLDQGDGAQDVAMQGAYDYAPVDTPDGAVPGLHGWIHDISGSLLPNIEDQAGTEIIIIGTVGYSQEAGATTWIRESLEESALLGLGLLFGVPAYMGDLPDVYPTGAFTVDSSQTEDEDGQAVLVQTLTLDLETVLNDPETLAALVDPVAPLLAGYGVENSADLIAAAPVLLPYLEGSELQTRLVIGQADGLLHSFEQTARLMLDLTATDPNAVPMALTYTLSGTYQYGATVPPIEAPAEYEEGSGGLGGMNPLN